MVLSPAIFSVLALLACATPAPDAAPDPPDATAEPAEAATLAAVRAYLEAGSTGGDVASHLDPKCANTALAKGGPVRLLGAVVTIDDLTLSEVGTEGDAGQVHYEIRGHIDAQAVHEKVKVLRKEVQVDVAEATAKGMDLAGTLSVARIDGDWKVTCR